MLRDPRRGMTIVVALAFLFVAALVAVAFQYLARGHRVLSVHALDAEVAFQFGTACTAAAIRHWFDRLNDPADPMYKAVAVAVGAGTVALPEFRPARHAGLSAIVKDFPGLDARVTGRLSDLAKVGEAFVDASEKKGLVEASCVVTLRGIRKAIHVSKRFKYVSVFPPVVSRFTLFVRENEPEAWNILDGSPDGQAGGSEPLVLDHRFEPGAAGGPSGKAAGAAADVADLSRSGWVYLGGGRVNLNLARGEANFGEDFHLPNGVVRSIFFPDGNHALLHFNAGFYAGAAKDPLFNDFPDEEAFRGSALRLFGAPCAGSRPSPTLVVGDVWRRYLQASAVAPLARGKFGTPNPLPWTVDWRNIPRGPTVPTFLFLSPRLYQAYMSQQREEPYNRSFDHLVSEGKSPTPLRMKGEIGERVGSPYPLDEPELALRDYKGGTVYRGRLRDFVMADAIGPRVCLSAPDAHEFVAGGVVDTPAGRFVHLNAIYRVGGRAVDFGPLGELAFAGRGLLVFEGDVTLPDVRLRDPARDAVTFLSLHGSITLAGSRCEAGLVALEGSVAPRRRADVTGVLAAGRLDPAAFRRGGRLRYDARFNPENPAYRDFYAIELSPRLFSYREE